MLTMNAGRVIFLVALCFMCVSSNDKQVTINPCEEYDCEKFTVHAPPGSSVLLPCNFSTISSDWVSWVHIQHGKLVNLTSKGRVKFVDPRDGRVKAFPNHGSEGNYSIGIDDLKDSDHGCYRCDQGHHCHQVEVAAEIATEREDALLLIIICVSGAALILLIAGSYCCMKCILWCWNRTQESTNNPVGAGTEGVGASAPPEEPGMVPSEQQRGEDNLVYENDDQGPANWQSNPTRDRSGQAEIQPDQDRNQPTQSIYPDLNHFNAARMESQRRKQRFHTELFSRLRQASLSRHYYVNRDEISRQQATSTQVENNRGGDVGKKKKKKARENCDYKNPIYNRSTEQLNHL